MDSKSTLIWSRTEVLTPGSVKSSRGALLCSKWHLFLQRGTNPNFQISHFKRVKKFLTFWTKLKNKKQMKNHCCKTLLLCFSTDFYLFISTLISAYVCVLLGQKQILATFKITSPTLFCLFIFSGETKLFFPYESEIFRLSVCVCVCVREREREIVCVCVFREMKEKIFVFIF